MTGGAAVAPIESFIKTEQAAIDQRLRELIDQELDDRDDPIAHAIRYAVDAPGKRLRPVLLIAAYRSCGGASTTAVYDVASSVELVHTYSLVHDDLPCMDDDSLRRGRPTLHRIFGNATATVAGAALIPLAFRVCTRGARALELSSETVQQLVVALSRGAGAGGMVGGQQLDLSAEGNPVTVESLETIHTRKTGALIAAVCRMGAIAANANEREVDALGMYGRRVGLAFQIADDVLDETATSAELGKSTGRDQHLSKATFPTVLGLEAAQERAQREVAQALHTLEQARLLTPELERLARFAVERRN